MLVGNFEFMLHEAWDFLMDEEAGPIAICGQGGIGKTTLLRQLYNKLLTTQHFQTLIWITISSNSTPEKIQDVISKSIGLFDVQWVYSSFVERSQLIRDRLSRKTFALLLDDIWKQVDLSELGVPNFVQNRKNKLVFTTRSMAVANSMFAQLTLNIGELSTEDAHKLFRYKVGNDMLRDRRIFKLSQVLVDKCEGLPIFLCILGRAMASRQTRKEWLDAVEKIKSLESRNSRENCVLQFCFNSLLDHKIEECLMYLSLFPEDFAILKNDLIDFWICEHLLDENDAWGDILGSGYNTIRTLVRAGLMEEEEHDCVKLLDMIRDFASSLAIECPIFENPLLLDVTPKKLISPVGWPSSMGSFMQNLSGVSYNLLIFLLNHNPFVMIKRQHMELDKEGNFSEFINVITVLDLSYSGIEEVPREISKLISLRYLNLSHTWIERLPVELKMLTKLNCLNLEHNDQLRVLSKQLVYSLCALQVLKIFRCGYSVEEFEDNILLVKNMDLEPLLSLENLRVLSITITCAYALNTLFTNRKLLTCIQSLSLEIFWGSKSLDISPIASMKNLLTLEIHQAEVLEELNGNLRCSMSLSEGRFERLQRVALRHCSNLRESTWITLAPSLRILEVKNCEKMEEIVSLAQAGTIFEGGNEVEPFAKLEILVLESLPKLKSVYWKALPLQHLKKFEIIDCSLLRKLPLNSTSANSKLKEVVIEAEEDWWKNVEWEDDATKTTFAPCFRQSFLM